MRGSELNLRPGATARLPLAAFVIVVLLGGVGRRGEFGTCRLLADEPRLPSVRLSTRAGDLVVGALSLTEIPVQTEYGLLRIPTAEVAVVEFARRLTENDTAEIVTAIEALRTDADANKRDAARASLVQHGSLALDSLRNALSSEGKELNIAINDIIESIIEREPEELSTTDRVVARRFTITGDVQMDTIQVKCSYGDLALSRNDVARIVVGTGSWRGAANEALIIKSWTDVDGEYRNVMGFLPRQTKLHFQPFAARDPALFRKHLRNFRIIVVPELEQSNNGLKNFAKASAKTLRKFVNDGGCIVSCGGAGNGELLNATGLLKFRVESSSSPARVVKRHPLLRGISGAIPQANATYPIFPQGRPKIVPLAATGEGGIVVGIARIGDGTVIYCGWDFYNSTEVHQRILSNAVLWTAGRLGRP